MDIIQLFGTSSVPAIVAGSVLGVFELGERFASQQAKDTLSKWLLTFDVQKTKALPDGTRELFERIFGERHFSLKCFIRSAAFSLGAIAFIGILVFMVDPKEALKMMQNIVFEQRMCYHFPERTVCGSFYALIELTLWVPWSILIDYLSLFKTRIILGAFTRLRRGSSVATVAIIGIDFIVYKLLFSLGLTLMTAGTMIVGSWSFGYWLDFFRIENIMHQFATHWKIKDDLSFIFFWSGFAPSIWMWLYVLALFVTRGLLRSEKLVNWLRWALDIDKAPFRSIGAVAATLAFIVSVVVILVSAEVSRISTAS
jgi:hypothetical protein